MFGKKQPEQPSQSQTMSGLTATGGVVQQGQAGRDAQQNQSGTLKTQQEITNTYVVKQLEKLGTAIQNATLIDDEKNKLLAYLEPAKLQATADTVDKNMVGLYLKPVSETLQTMKDTTEAGKSLWKTGQEVFGAIAPWLGAAAKLIGM